MSMGSISDWETIKWMSHPEILTYLEDCRGFETSGWTFDEAREVAQEDIIIEGKAC